jgi:nucleoside-diphosphate-sugar epimerase
MMRRVLLTGATGFLGRALVRALLAQQADREVWAIVRPTNGLSGSARPELHGLRGLPRFHMVAGDIELPGFGFGADDDPAAVLPRGIDACFHLAARTEFRDRWREQTFLANLGGTRHLVEFLKRLPRFGKLYHVSTAYVSGIGTGMIDETLHDRPAGFANAYEESKHAAESVVAGSGLDWTILRPSILIGHSGTGEGDDKTVYGVFKTFWRLREVLRNKYSDVEIEVLPANPFVVVGRPEVAKNVLCVDDVVRLMLGVASRRPPSGTVYHLVNPRPTNVSAVTGSMLSRLALNCVVLDPRPPGTPRPEEQLIERGTEIYRPYLMNDEAEFDQTRLRQLIGDRAVDSVLPMTRSRLDFLFDRYLHCQLEGRRDALGETPVDRLAPVRRHGRGILAYSSIGGRSLALPLGGDAGFVSCAVKGRTAAMVGDPVCAPQRFELAAGTFLGWCGARGYRPVAVQVSRPLADLLARSGGHCNRMGDEAIVDLKPFDESLSGRSWEKLRRHRNAARAAGITVHEGSYADVPAAVVERVSRSWLRSKINHRELALLLRPLPLHDEPDVRKFFAFRGGELVGFVIFDPLYEAEEIVGYYADVERYLPSPNGIHDLVLLEAIRVFRVEGRAILSLGLAPLFHLDALDHPSASALTGDLLRQMRDEVAPVYNFKGVSEHKRCYNPRWEPTYFYSARLDATREVLDVLSLIGLLAPEALSRVGPETFDRVQGA